MNDVQQAILGTFEAVKSAFETLNLRYFAIGGTAIGAVRHGGFIPWDDDIDIALPIEDYLQFIARANDVLPERYRLQTFRGSEHNHNVFAKVVDTKTTCIERKEAPYPDAYKGVWVDIMPMSGVPKGSAGTAFVRQVERFCYVSHVLPWRLSDMEKASHKALWIACRPMKLRHSAQDVLTKWENLLAAHPFDDAELVGYTWSRRLEKFTFPKQWFDGCVEMPFEGMTISMPVGYDAYLTSQFGDYMTIPPKEKQVVHFVFTDLHTPYAEYAKNPGKVQEAFK